MYGWPMPFNNVWYKGNGQGEWLPSILLLDIVTWLVLAGAAGLVAEGWCRKANRLQISLGSLFVVQIVAALLLALGSAEGYLRAHPNNDSIIPRYGHVNVGGNEVWFDIGLFTDPPLAGLLTRIAIIVAIGCAIFSVIQLLIYGVERLRRTISGSPAVGDVAVPPHSITDERHCKASGEPIIARIAIWCLLIIIVLSLPSLLPAVVR